MRGPLYVLPESWVARERNTESVVSHVLAIRERMEQMSSLVKESLEKAQQSQKARYDQTTRDRTLKEGDTVLVLLPTSSNTQWQGPCTGLKLYRAVHFWLPNLYRPGTLLVAKSVPALPKVYRPGAILVTKSVPVLPKVCRVEHKHFNGYVFIAAGPCTKRAVVLHFSSNNTTEFS